MIFAQAQIELSRIIHAGGIMCRGSRFPIAKSTIVNSIFDLRWLESTYATPPTSRNVSDEQRNLG